MTGGIQNYSKREEASSLFDFIIQQVKKMEAIKQIVRIPENHELKIKVPDYIPANELAEIVLLINKKKEEQFKIKINELKKAKSDRVFLEDLKSTLDDFKILDSASWI